MTGRFIGLSNMTVPERIIHRNRTVNRISPRWEPKEWQPHYDEIVLLSTYGIANTAIAERYDLTAQQVSNILNTEKGLAKKEEFRRITLAQAQQNIGGRLEVLSEKAVGVMEKVFSNGTAIENMIHNQPLSLLNNMMSFLKSTGKLKGDSKIDNLPAIGGSVNINNITVNQQNNNVTVPIAYAERVASGLAMLEKIDEIHGNVISNANSESVRPK